MHVGATMGPDAARPLLRLADRHDGAVSGDGRVAGCYLHGLFAGDAFRRAWLSQLSGRDFALGDYETGVDAALDALAEAIEAHLDVDGLIAAARAPTAAR
jgi:adenosylcobyric acid synthase